MTNQQHPITPPPELVGMWIREANHNGMPTGECWNVLTSALSQDPPYQLQLYSQAVAGIMGQQGAK